MEYTQTMPSAIVIEDEVQLAEIYAKALEMSGFAITIYNNGLQAMQALGLLTNAPRLIILDLNLPQASGKEILRFIRGKEVLSKTRVILATSDNAAVVGELEKNADLVLLKPISFTQLRELSSRFR